VLPAGHRRPTKAKQGMGNSPNVAAPTAKWAIPAPLETIKRSVVVAKASDKRAWIASRFADPKAAYSAGTAQAVVDLATPKAARQLLAELA